MANRLGGETSPYLLQHAENPVDWHPWGDEAFEKARREDKAVLLSVGYSSCHWCHVMAHESFEDPDTAAMMNERFVNVKVDREERPDVDAVYMTAVQSLTGRGGWPMTVWLTPDAEPFYAGTYFPPDDRHGMPSFRRVMEAVSDAWRNRREGVVEQAAKLTAAIDRSIPATDELPGLDQLEQAYLHLRSAFDERNGGLGGAPKFPQEPTLEFLLRVGGRPWAPDALEMAFHTLARMAQGGLWDHIGGGFSRYAVDATWTIPHFEKMLYTNAQLARLYLRAWQSGGPEHFRRVAESTLDYLVRDMTHPEGGWYSAEDADSEGVEGKFYVFTHDEFGSIVGSDDAPIAAAYFGVRPQGNFEGANHLHQALTLSELADRFDLGEVDAAAAVERARVRLYEARSTRIRPGLDDKVVTAWNGLALRAFAEAGAILGEPRYLEAARANARFVLDRLVVDGRLMRSWGKERAHVPGFVDDYAGYAIGLLSLYMATGEVVWYQAADRLVRRMVEDFWDPEGGLFHTAHDAERLITRPKDQMDNPLPSGHSLAVEALLWLSLYTGEPELREVAEAIIRESGRLVEAYPSAVGHLLAVLDSLHEGMQEVAIVGADADGLTRVVWERFRPRLVLAVDRAGADGEVVPLLDGRHRPDATLAYVCERFVCAVPVGTPDELRSLIE